MRSRPFLLLLICALAVALIVVAVMQSLQGLRAGSVAQNIAPDLNRAYLPPIIRDATVVGDRLRLQGTAEPDSIVRAGTALQSLRQISTDEAGRWSMEVAAPSTQLLQLSVESYVGDDRVVGDDQLLFVPAPGAEDGISQRPLIALAVPGGPTRVLQTPFGAGLEGDLLSVDSIDYDNAGGVILAGRSRGEGRVRLSTGERLLGEAPLATDGRWFFLAVDAPPDRKVFTVSLIDTNGERDRLDIDFVPLTRDETLRREPTIWQVRRALPGGGSQVSVVLATPVGASDPAGDDAEDG